MGKMWYNVGNKKSARQSAFLNIMKGAKKMQSNTLYNVIIPQNVVFVNGDINITLSQKSESGNGCTAEKWKDKKIKSLRMAEKMKKAGYLARGKRMAECSDIITYKVCPECGEYHIAKANLCRDRFCPVCSWRLSLSRFANMARVMDALQNGYPEYRYSLITLTVKNCKAQELSKTMETMSSCWHLAVNQRRIRQFMVGWARSVEITYNKETGELHPHYHIILMSSPESSADYDLVSEWQKACNKKGLKTSIKAQNTQEIQAKDGEKLIKSILETIKYALKSDQMEQIPIKTFRQIVGEMSKKRLFASGGKIKEYMKLCDITSAEMEKATDEENIKISCNRCNVEMLDMIYKWSFGESKYKPI